jgi:putative FmdB family regulatory protein
MPTYDYRCRACDHVWELFQSIKANPVRKCPKCGKLKAQRQIGPGAGIIFKGSGFYQTDYRSSAYKKAAEADKSTSDSAAKSESKSTGDSSGAKSESKPAAKTSE